MLLLLERKPQCVEIFLYVFELLSDHVATPVPLNVHHMSLLLSSVTGELVITKH